MGYLEVIKDTFDMIFARIVATHAPPLESKRVKLVAQKLLA